MNCAWSGTLSQLKGIIQSGKFFRTLALGFKAVYQKPTEAEIFAWEHSIPEVLLSLEDPKFNYIQVIIELAMPIGAERADLVLLGGTRDAPRAIVVELKQWSNIKFLYQSCEVDVPLIGVCQHPSLQG